MLKKAPDSHSSVSNTGVIFRSSAQGVGLFVRVVYVLYFVFWLLSTLLAFPVIAYSGFGHIEVSPMAPILWPPLSIIMILPWIILTWRGAVNIPVCIEVEERQIVIHTVTGVKEALSINSVLDVSIVNKRSLLRGATSWAYMLSTPFGMMWIFDHKDMGSVCMYTRGRSELVAIRSKEFTTVVAPDEPNAFVALVKNRLEQAVEA